AIAFDCTERDDGDYEVLSCIEHFVTCFGGKAIPRVCSPGLLFDDNVKQCEFPKYIPKCGGHARTTPTTAAAPDDVPATTITYNFNCERRQDGAHADPDTPCSRHFFMCSSGRTFFLKCPDNLFFNRNSTECDYRKAVVECKKPTKLLSTRKT
uniref:Chitin-binding type-2 domain-containing protein n=1 Tax=Romanomermis culicivorax TaxID=13658 RepID=A0A915L7I5_ROMCU